MYCVGDNVVNATANAIEVETKENETDAVNDRLTFFLFFLRYEYRHIDLFLLRLVAVLMMVVIMIGSFVQDGLMTDRTLIIRIDIQFVLIGFTVEVIACFCSQFYAQNTQTLQLVYMQITPNRVVTCGVGFCDTTQMPL